MDLSFYRDRDSFFHRLDGLTKLALLAGTCVLGLASSRVGPLGALVALVLGHLVLSESAGNLRRVWRFLAILTAMTTLLWAASGRGETPMFLWVKREGLWAGVSAALRIDAFVLAGTAFLSTTTSEEMLQALLRLRVPYPVCFAFSTALRLAPSFVGLGLAVREAQRARGLDPEAGSPMARLRKSVPLLVPAFLSTLRTTGQLALSLESRGFGFSPRRTFLFETRAGWRDAVALGVLTATLAAAVWLR
ncbi:MAG: energy-coupling factor transporter transmembrane protein EcfT [Deltaproteobacteria bacterium]|nr:energy-coupling factor transporter transmembrane protein EcfT [Deltaproteobacteria bacterium]